MDCTIKGKVCKQLSFISLFDLEFKHKFDLGISFSPHIKVCFFFVGKTLTKTVKLTVL